MPRSGLDRFEQRKQTRARLIDAALKLFSTSGYEHATVDDISQEAGYSKGAYYFHFSTKDDILLELLRMWTESRGAALLAGGAEDEAPDLRAVLEGLFSYEADGQWPAVLLEFWSQSVRNAEVGKRVAQAYAGWRRQLAEAFSRAAAAGRISLASAEDAAAIALAAHDGYAVQVAIGSLRASEMSAAQLADSLIAPLEAPAEGGRTAAAM